jgi:Domain of unknown function (DUF4276)
MRHKRTPGRRRRKSIGIIAEDDSDISVLDELIKKAARAPYSLRWFAAGGCGKIVSKANAWAANLRSQGCRYLLLVQDLDRAQILQLRASLTIALGNSPIQPHLIVIPVREIEAWLLADHQAIFSAMKLVDNLGQIANPESLQNPKEYLGRLIYSRSRKKTRYVNAIHNAKIAALCKSNNLRRCPSYIPFHDFISEHI